MHGFLKCELVEMSSIERILGYVAAWLLNEYSMLSVHVLLIYSRRTPKFVYAVNGSAKITNSLPYYFSTYVRCDFSTYVSPPYCMESTAVKVMNETNNWVNNTI